MNYLKILLIFALLQSCLTEPRSLCEDVTCKSWQYCHKDYGSCRNKEGRCSDDFSCRDFEICNKTTHTCENISCDDHSLCGVMYDKSFCLNEICHDSVNCNNDSECSYLNTENIDFKCVSENCVPFEQINFGQTIEKKLYNPETYYFKLNSLNSIYDFDFEISNLNNLTGLYIEANLFTNINSIYNPYFYSCVKANNKPETLYCKVSAIKKSNEIYLSVKIEYNYCWNCEPVKPLFKFSENNSLGCFSNDDCKTISQNYQSRSVCDLLKNSCVAKQEENISEIGEVCDIDKNCKGYENEDVVCGDVCYQLHCSDNYPCKLSSQYCDDRYPELSYCRNYCYELNDGNCSFQENCDVLTNKCKFAQ